MPSSSRSSMPAARPASTRSSSSQLDGHELSQNARTAIEDQRSIAYLGELQPGTSQIPVEITNQQGLLVVSPVDTAAYLTQPVPPPVATEPSSVLPVRSTYDETFARVVPNSATEAKAIVAEMQAQGVSHAVRLQRRRASTAPGDGRGGRARRQGGADHRVSSASAADGVFYGASVISPQARTAATHALDNAASASPSAKLFAPSGLYDNSFVAGLSAGAAQRLTVSSPGFLPKDLTAAGRTFTSEFRSSYGHAPAPQAIFGYEAMSALLYVLDKAGVDANQRSTIVTDFRKLTDPPDSVIGPYSIKGGDTNIAPFIFSARACRRQVDPVQVCPAARVIGRVEHGDTRLGRSRRRRAVTLSGCGSVRRRDPEQDRR